MESVGDSDSQVGLDLSRGRSPNRPSTSPPTKPLVPVPTSSSIPTWFRPPPHSPRQNTKLTSAASGERELVRGIFCSGSWEWREAAQSAAMGEREQARRAGSSGATARGAAVAQPAQRDGSAVCKDQPQARCAQRTGLERSQSMRMLEIRQLLPHPPNLSNFAVIGRGISMVSRLVIQITEPSIGIEKLLKHSTSSLTLCFGY
ncbi:hypothetical protein GQ55_5G339700 [Panicum hallii var. hallii]|uniref:Uncharacterized protein n=1 Tax=Panicum hallii var. hallii TaxID=1504633 RepID=A0A2T7DM19_9POAL|nr:hypothetical protein GQ55_5G339700 [Panicum hallii var. hallii]PUZ56622.1 hypothetical protein GQ55_5G339700 [Panicum hallii var. hallii]